MTRADVVLNKLEGVRGAGADRWMAKCPSHDDNKASLSIGVGAEGRILLKCQAGCETADVVELLGLALGDLFVAKPEGKRIVATYSYYDEKGALLYEAVRYDPKDFRQRRPDGTGGYHWNLQDTRRVLYRLPELLASKPGATVYVVEGEKDADALANMGLLATCNVGGAGKWKPEYSKHLAGRWVIVLPDNDEPGRAHAKQVIASTPGAVALELPNLPPKGDVSDWIAMGGNRSALEALIPSGNSEIANTFQSSTERLPGERDERIADGRRVLSFGVRYLDHALGGIARRDLILVGAKTGLGKTALATIIALHNCAAGKRVHFFALEAEDREIERRMKYQVIADMYYASGSHLKPIRFLDWRDGRLEKELGSFEDAADMEMRRMLKNLHTLYRSGTFTADDFCRHLEAIKDSTDLVILDHLHYVDTDDENENRGYKAMVKQIRDAAIRFAKPVIVIAHVRKSDRRNDTLVPTVEDFHGSSDIPKIATKSIMLAPAYDWDTGIPHLLNTYFQVNKCRPDASTARYTALVPFNLRRNTYDDTYTIGKIAYSHEDHAHKFQHITGDEMPSWAMQGSNGSGL